MSDTVSINFVYESGCIDGISRSLWKILDEQNLTEVRTEFDGEQLSTATESAGEGMYGIFRAPKPGDDLYAPPVPHLEIVNLVDLLRRVNGPSADIEGIISGATTIYESLSTCPDLHTHD